MATVAVERAVVVGPQGSQHVDLDSRSVDWCDVSKENKAPLKQRLQEIRPALENHFKIRLSDFERPQYLTYRPGDFFKLHRDVVGRQAHEAIHGRRVSVVIFLNRQSQEPAEDTYGEGNLTFYGLLEGPQWEKCAFPLNAEPGLLIAFPSDEWHEVKPVSHGRRMTVVTWFHSR